MPSNILPLCYYFLAFSFESGFQWLQMDKIMIKCSRLVLAAMFWSEIPHIDAWLLACQPQTGDLCYNVFPSRSEKHVGLWKHVTVNGSDSKSFSLSARVAWFLSASSLDLPLVKLLCIFVSSSEESSSYGARPRLSLDISSPLSSKKKVELIKTHKYF